MHTDEYEISLGREISLCRKMIKGLTNKLHEREKKTGMTTEAFLKAPEPSLRSGENRHLQNWRKDHEELRKWQQMLSEYERALQMVKGI
jgi:hypothetical protein